MPTANQRVLQLLSVDQILDRQFLTVAPDTPVAAVVEHMCQAAEVICLLPQGETDWPSRNRSSCALVMVDEQLLGIFTERDLVRLLAEEADLEAIAISEVMTHPVITMKRSEASSIFGVLALLKQHRIRHLPLLDDTGALLGLITQTSIRLAMQPFNFLKIRRVGDVMTRAVIRAPATESLLKLAQRMTQHRVSCIVITASQQRGALQQQVPIGIVTERDMLQFRALGLSLAQIQAETVMSTPLFLVQPQDTLWMAHQQMQQRHTRRLVVANEAGGLAGIVTQSSLLHLLDPLEMLGDIEQLQQLSEAQTYQLAKANQQLQQTNQHLEQEIAKRQQLELALQDANRILEARVGIQAAQLVQTGEALTQEIRERQRAQAQLEEFFSVTPSLLCIAGLDGYFKRLNPNFAKTLGYDNAELLAHPFLFWVHPDDQAATQRELERMAAGEVTIAFENRYRCKDGSYRWFRWNSTADLAGQTVYAAAQDVTERKQFEVALRQERNFTAAVLDTIGALVVVLDRQGQVVRFNKTCEHVTGYMANEMMGRPIWDVLIPDEEESNVQAVFEHLRQGQAANHFENYWIHKDGTRRLIRWSNTVLKDADGRVEYIIGTGIDVTLQRQTEQHLTRQHQQGQLLSEITRKIRESLDIDEILQTAVVEALKLLACDRVIIIQCEPDGTGRVIQESAQPAETSLSCLNQPVTGLKFTAQTLAKPSYACACDDLSLASCSLYTSEFLKQFDGRSCVEVAIHVGARLWGLIVASQCDRPYQWQAFEIELMQQLANQIGVAISHAQLLDNLEAQVEHRTHQLIQINDQLKQEIQERIQIEIELLEMQQKLTGILDNADEAIISIDLNQQIVMYNRGAEKIFGYTVEEVRNQPLDLLLPHAFRSIHQQHVRSFVESPEHSRQMTERRRDVFGQRKTGETFPAEASISKLQTKTGPLLTVMLKDITDQRQAEAALRRSEEQLRLTTNALPALICYVDGEQRYRFNNQTYEDWFNTSVSDLQGRYIWEVIGDKNYVSIKPHVEDALAGHKVSYETEFVRPDGLSCYLLATYIPDVDQQGQVKGFFGLINDISDRKAAERMKDEFVSVVGHELRTPLTSIHGSLVLLASKQLGTLTPQGQEFLEISLKNTQRLTRLINDVLDLERIETGRSAMSMQPCSAADILQQAVQAMQPVANAKTIDLVVASANIDVWADPDHLIQVLTNLLSNAIKFSPEGHTVWLNVSQQEQEVLFEVKDQGRGIPSDKMEIIFERFQQVDASDSRELGGTGLGLAICRNIVQRHGGKIWAESALGEGSSFFFTLSNVQHSK